MRNLNIKLALRLALTAFVPVTTFVAPAALAVDRVGNGNGRTVELALSNLNQKLPGADYFHQILFAFENGHKIDFKKYSGLWTGLQFASLVDQDGSQKLAVTEQALLGLYYEQKGPLLAFSKALVASGDFRPSWGGRHDYLIGEVRRTVRWFSEKDPEFVGSALKIDRRQWLDKDDGPEGRIQGYFANKVFEFHAYAGIIVGVSRPSSEGGPCFPESEIRSIYPNICQVFYFYNNLPLVEPEPEQKPKPEQKR